MAGINFGLGSGAVPGEAAGRPRIQKLATLGDHLLQLLETGILTAIQSSAKLSPLPSVHPGWRQDADSCRRAFSQHWDVPKQPTKGLALMTLQLEEMVALNFNILSEAKRRVIPVIPHFVEIDSPRKNL
jgi:hypothetical protein